MPSGSVCGHAPSRPPSVGAASSSVTRTPRSASTTAALTPAMPPPTTTAPVPAGAARGRPGSAGTSTRGRILDGPARRVSSLTSPTVGVPTDSPRNGRPGPPVVRSMTVELGRYGIFRGAAGLTPELAREIEAAGFGAIWIGSSPPGDLALPESLLAATDHIAVATGIVNMWATPAEEVAPSYHRLEAAYPGRFLLGVGIGHPEANRQYKSPLATIVDYLDALDALEVPQAGRALAALGPKVLKVAAERTAGAHPYLTTPQHTREARELVGPGVLLAPEQKVVLDTDPARARALGRARVENPYLHLTNYVSNLKRLGWTDADVADGGSDALVDALAVHGDAATVAAGLTAHLDAGADHVCAQVLTGDDNPLPAIRELAAQLNLS